MSPTIHQQEICPDCLQMLVNGESNHTPEELATMQETLDKWSKENYVPAGMTDQEEAYFSHNRCDLCDGLAGNRFEYNFFDNSI